MPTPKAVLKSVGPKLVPFLKTSAVYFVLLIPYDNPSWFACLIKILPIISLCFFVLLHGMNLSDEYAYSRRILCGLIFSMLGDSFLLWRQYLLHGMVAFAIAHLLYASAFGMYPFKPMAGGICFSIFAVVCTIIYPYIQGTIYTVCTPIYGLLIAFMTWRAVARVQLFNDLWTWTNLCSCGGAVLFCISDFILSFKIFVSDVPYSHVMIMTTYYAAQLGIALSVVDSMEGKIEPRKSRVEEMEPRQQDASKSNDDHISLRHRNIKVDEIVA